MKRLLFINFILIFLSACKSEKANHFLFPEGALPIIYNGYILIPCSVENVTGDFLLDTGTDNFHLDSIFYSENIIAYKNYQNGKIWGIGNSFQFAMMIFDTVDFQFNHNIIKTPNVLVHSLKPIGGDIVDGLIGLNYFSKKVLELNYEREYINIHASIDSVDTSGYCIIPMEIIEDRLCIPLEIKVDDSLALAGYFMIDIGSELSTMTSFVSQKFNFNSTIERKVAYYNKYGGIGGESNGYDFIADSLYISNFGLAHVNFSYSTDTFGVMTSDAFFGIIGNNILDRFDVLFDFLNNNLYLRPNAKFNVPYEFNCLGFSFVDRNETLRGWIVTGFSKNSMAEKQGLQIDDRIISVNNIPVNKIPYKSYDDIFKKNTEVELIIVREGNISVVKFKLVPQL